MRVGIQGKSSDSYTLRKYLRIQEREGETEDTGHFRALLCLGSVRRQSAKD